MMKYLILSLLLGGVVFTRVTAQEPLPAETATKTAPPHGSTDPARAYRDAADSLDQDLRSALDELAALRAVIAAEKPAIATESNRVAADLRENASPVRDTHAPRKTRPRRRSKKQRTI